MSSRTGGAPANSSVPMAMGGSGYGSGAGTGSGGLSEEEAGREMKKMLAFIMQEADEKVNEIKVKANEEFNIEKAKLVRMESAAIEAQHDRRLKQAEVKRRM